MNSFACCLESLVEVLLLLYNLITQRLVLLLYALDENVGKFAHVSKFAFHTL